MSIDYQGRRNIRSYCEHGTLIYSLDVHDLMGCEIDPIVEQRYACLKCMFRDAQRINLDDYPRQEGNRMVKHES